MEGISGEKGEGFAGTIIEDTWTITRGEWKREGGGEGWGVGLWGGEAENCLNNNKKYIKK